VKANTIYLHGALSSRHKHATEGSSGAVREL